MYVEMKCLDGFLLRVIFSCVQACTWLFANTLVESYIETLSHHLVSLMGFQAPPQLEWSCIISSSLASRVL